MIIDFGNSETEKIWDGEFSKKYPNEIQNIVRRKLRMINNAFQLQDLRVPANRLEKLKGDLDGYYSIRVNDQWRIIFIWDSGSVFEVELVDYH